MTDAITDLECKIKSVTLEKLEKTDLRACDKCENIFWKEDMNEIHEQLLCNECYQKYIEGLVS